MRARPGRPRSARADLDHSRPASPARSHPQARPHRSALFSGIGNAYSDEILHRARLSPMHVDALSDDEIGRLFVAPRLLCGMARRLRRGPPTGSREGHCLPRRDGRPWPLRSALPGARHPVQRIRYADNETNYCPRCQTGGRLLADRRCRGCSKTTGRERSRSWNGTNATGGQTSITGAKTNPSADQCPRIRSRAFAARAQRPQRQSCRRAPRG